MIGKNYMRLDDQKIAFKHFYLSEINYQKTDSISETRIWNLAHLAISFIDKSLYSEALERLLKAQKLATTSDKYYKPLAQIYTSMAHIYGLQGNFEKSIEFYKEAIVVLKDNKDSINISRTTINLLGSYVKNEKTEIALSILNNLPKENLSLIEHFYVNLNKSEIFLIKKEFEKAEFFNSKALVLKDTINIKSVSLLADIQSAEIQEGLNMSDKALEILQGSLIKTDSFSLRSKNQILSILEKIYAKKGDYQKAYETLSQHSVIKDTISKNEQKNKTEFLKMVFNEEKSRIDLEKKESELNFLKEKNKLTRKYIIIISICFAIVFLLSLIIFLKQRKLLSLEKNKKELEKESLKQKLEHNHQHIIDLSLYIKKNRELLSNVKKVLKTISPIDEKNKLLILSIMNTINEDIQVNKEKLELRTLIEKKNINFNQELLQKHPALSTKEQQIIQLLRLEYSSKQIASELSLSIYSIDTYRSKIRNKMKVPKNIKLSKFVQNL
jgi:DNA-binding CsgD family transcriptional regulator